MKKLSIILSLFFASSVIADTGITRCTSTRKCAGASANVGLTVIIPGFIRFQLGAATSTPTVVWDFSGEDGGVLTSADLGTGPVPPSSQANTGTSTPGDVTVALQSNLGNDVNVTLSNTDGGGFDTNIGFANILVESRAIPAPPSAAAGTTGPTEIGTNRMSQLVRITQDCTICIRSIM